MKIKIFIILMLSMLVFNSGCKTMCDNFGMFCPESSVIKPEFNIREDINDVQETIEESSTSIEKATEGINKEANNINKEANSAQDKIPVNIKPQISPHINNIKESSNSIIKNTNEINKANAQLSSAINILENVEKKVKTTEEALDKLAKERDDAIIAKNKAEEERDSQMQKMLQWLIVSCIIGAGACVLILALASFVQTYFIYLAIIGGCLLLLLLIGLIWNIIVQKKAFSQIVETVEVAKTGLSVNKKEELFGKNGQTGIMDSIQSPETIKMVSKEKKKMLLWNSMKNKKE